MDIERERVVRLISAREQTASIQLSPDTIEEKVGYFNEGVTNRILEFNLNKQDLVLSRLSALQEDFLKLHGRLPSKPVLCANYILHGFVIANEDSVLQLFERRDKTDFIFGLI